MNNDSTTTMPAVRSALRETVPVPRRTAEPASDNSMALLVQTGRALLRWWAVALPAGLLLGGLGAAFVWFTFEKQYRASAWVQIQDQPTYLAYQAHETPGRYVQNQIELLRSSMVLGPVTSDPEASRLPELQAQEDPTAWLARQLRIVNVGGSELFEISLDSVDGQRAADVINAVTRSYLGLRSEHDHSRNQQMLELLEEEKELRAREVTRLRENVRQLSRDILGMDPFTGQATAEVVIINHPLQALLTQLTGTEVDRKMLEVQLATYKKSTASRAGEIPDALVNAAVERHPDLLELKALLSGKTAMLDRIEEASVHGVDDPAYKRVKREVDRLDQSIERTRKSLKPRLREEMLVETQLKQDEELDSIERSLEVTKGAEELLRKQYETQAKSLGESGGQSLELEFAKAELAREEKVFELIAQRALALKTEARAPARSSLMKAADTPLTPIEQYPLKRLVLAFVAGFCVPLGLVVLWERWVRRIVDADQLGQHTTIHVVGEVAKLPPRRTLSPELAHRHLSLFEESVDSLRTCLVLGQGNDDVRVIAVASAVSGEGKTSVAAQLAVSIARSTGQKTLIIDADMRSPDVHRIFQVANETGLADILEGTATLSECVNTDWSDYVHVLTAGSAATNPHTLINSPRFVQLLAEARGIYEHVIIDTPPILLASEALVIAKDADGTLLCTMRDRSREVQVNSAAARLQAVGARSLGAVLSGIPSGQYTAKYGGYAYSG